MSCYRRGLASGLVERSQRVAQRTSDGFNVAGLHHCVVRPRNRHELDPLRRDDFIPSPERIVRSVGGAEQMHAYGECLRDIAGAGFVHTAVTVHEPSNLLQRQLTGAFAEK